MSQAFLNGFRASRNMGMGDVRMPMMRSLDQAQTQSGNPGLAYNAPRMRPPQQMPPINQVDPRMGGLSQQMPPQMMGAPQQQGNFMRPGYRAPVLRGEPVAQVAEMPVQGQINYRVPSGPMFTNLNAGRYGRNRPMNQ